MTQGPTLGVLVSSGITWVVAGLFLDISTARLLLLDPDAVRFVPVPDDQLPAHLVVRSAAVQG